MNRAKQMIVNASAHEIPLKGLDESREVCYTVDAETSGSGAFCFFATIPHNHISWAKRPSQEDSRPATRLSNGGKSCGGRFAMVVGECKWCGKIVRRCGNKPAVFCSVECKSEWQKTQKPVSEEWLREKYCEEGLGTYQIARLVNRDPKQVWHWLKGYGIPTRERSWDIEARPELRPYQDAGWLRWHYLLLQESASEIAAQFGVTKPSIIFWLRKHNIPRRTTSEARKAKHWGASGEDNPMYGVKGENHPGWKGGCTPERQACYRSEEWFRAVSVVRKRDKYRCQRCGAKNNLHIHHVITFAAEDLRCEPSNLILLCQDCHHWVHSSENTKSEYIKEWKGGGGNESSEADDHKRIGT